MQNKLIAKVTPDRKLEIPAEILAQLQPLTEYEILITENELKFTKKSNKLSLDELFQHIDESEDDTEAPSLEEISAIVKDVRKELWGNK
ncbi:hypothetical protein [Anabaena sp. UHCC 0451]|uniref:hypothetical protein n=1 Tax=Anabaena sp. UHCC 0451 TaxID=2055235 RepID=UPI002B21E2B9|nr:hypothetical protein [Anabaena sp. UHCC 0451]MEA5579560.1 hypothetical protein [Anabaena sp. UHCC 0451]